MTFLRSLSCVMHTHEQLVEIIRGIETKYKHPICILADLQGPKLRVGVFEKDTVSFCCGCCCCCCRRTAIAEDEWALPLVKRGCL